MVSMLALSAVDRGFEPWSSQTKDYEIGSCCFSAKHETLRRKSKYWLAWNQDNVSEWGDMSIRELLFEKASSIKIQLSVLVSVEQSGPHHYFIETHDIAEQLLSWR